jgi:hypothetical protein
MKITTTRSQRSKNPFASQTAWDNALYLETFGLASKMEGPYYALNPWSRRLKRARRELFNLVMREEDGFIGMPLVSDDEYESSSSDSESSSSDSNYPLCNMRKDTTRWTKSNWADMDDDDNDSYFSEDPARRAVLDDRLLKRPRKLLGNRDYSSDESDDDEERSPLDILVSALKAKHPGAKSSEKDVSDDKRATNYEDRVDWNSRYFIGEDDFENVDLGHLRGDEIDLGHLGTRNDHVENDNDPIDPCLRKDRTRRHEIGKHF